MVGFALSKINLLIFVTAMFVIIVYFTFGFSNILLKQQTEQMINRYSGEALSLIQSKSLCVQNKLVLPPSISYIGSQRIFYQLKIEKIDSTNPDKPNSLIFSIFARKDLQHPLASRRIDVKGNIFLFNQDDADRTLNAQVREVVVDPQAVGQFDSLFIAKQTQAVTVNGTVQSADNIYIANCSSATVASCQSAIQTVGASISAAHNGNSECVKATA